MRRRPHSMILAISLVSLAVPAFAQAEDSAHRLLVSQPVDPQLLREFMVEFNQADDNRRPVFERYLEDLGADAMLQALAERFPLCHHQATDLGAALFAGTRDLAATLDVCGDRCTSGCRQGAIREAFGKGSFEQAVAQLDALCEKGVLSDEKAKGSCAHAVGRALMMASSYELEPSLNACSGQPGEAMRYYCATGVYREYFMDPDELALEAILNLHFPCDQSSPYPAACYRYKGSLMLYSLGDDRDALEKECQALSGSQRLGCYHGLGAAHLSTVYQDPKLLATICTQERRDDRRVCIEGAMEKLADYDQGVAGLACRSLKGKDAKVCKAAVEEKMYRMHKPTLPLYTGGRNVRAPGGEPAETP